MESESSSVFEECSEELQEVKCTKNVMKPNTSALNIIKSSNKKERAVFVIMFIVNLANVLLVLIKGVTAYISSSFSIATSAIESFGDVFVSFLLIIQIILDKRVDKSEYPRGRSSEATTNLTASVVMMALAFFNFIQSFDSIMTGRFDPEFDKPHIIVLAVNIAMKFILFLLCLTKKDNKQIHVLMKDQWTDVKTNSVALIAVCLAHYVWKEMDFIGATLIFFLIVRNWAPIVSESWFQLQGIKGEESVNEVAEKILVKNMALFSEFKGYCTYHIGSKIVVEIFGEFDHDDYQKRVLAEFLDNKHIQMCYFMPIADSENLTLLTIDADSKFEGDETKLLEKL